MLWGRSVSGTAVAVLALTGAGGAGGAGGGATTLALVRGPVFSVAQEGSRIAWRECGGVRVADVARGTRQRAASPPSSVVPCQAIARSAGRETIVRRDGIAVARDLVAWTLFTQGNKEYLASATLELSSGRVEAKAELFRAAWWGYIASDLVGDGELILQGRVRRDTVAGCMEQDPLACDAPVTGGGVWSLGPR